MVVSRLAVRSFRGTNMSFEESPTFGSLASPWTEILDRIDQLGIPADVATYASLLRRCGTVKALADGKRVHSYIIKHGHERDRFLGNLLVEMYGKCGVLEDARDVFAKMHRRNVFSWTILIGAYVQQSRGKEAFRLFQQMQSEGVMPNKVTFVHILSACASEVALAEGKRMHALVVGSGLESNTAVSNALINMYAKCGSVDDARRLFDKMSERDVISWTAMITAYARNGQGKDARRLFEQMQLQAMLPNRVTFISVLEACTNQADFAEGKRMHACIADSGFESDVIVGNALITMYGKCGSIEDARRMFDKMPERNVVSWNSVIAAYVQHGQAKEALQLFQQMLTEGMLPNKVTFVSMLSACGSQADLAEGKWVHAQIVCMGSDFESDIVVRTSLVSMYAKCGSLENALRIFEKMHERNVVSWNAMIAAYTQCGQGNDALKLFQQMQLEGVCPDQVTFMSILDACANQAALAEGKWTHACIVSSGFESDLVVGNALVNMYGKCGSVEDAQRVFDTMPKRDVVSWTAMIAAYAHCGHGKKAFQLFQQMQLEGVTPNWITFVSILDACANQADLVLGKQIHRYINASGLESDVVVGTALLNMYAKCGSLEDALRIFNEMPRRKVVTWNAMIAAYVQHGHGKEALQLFQQMQLEHIIPDKVTCASILSVCASQGALAEGRWIHDCSVSNVFESDVTVGNALVSMYGKCGRLEDAQRMFDEMAERNVISWNAMIAVYAQHGHGKDALQLFQRMQLEGVVPDKVTFVSSLAACSHAGLMDEACCCFVSMSQDLGIIPAEEHYNCMVDLLGRAGRLDEGEDLINNMPFQPTAMSWMTLLGACRMHFDVDRGKSAAEHVFQLDSEDAAPHVLLSNIYAAAGRWDAAAKARKMVEDNGLKKQQGFSLMER